MTKDSVPKGVLKEFAAASEAIDSLDFSRPPEIELAIATNQRQVLCNSATELKQAISFATAAGLKDRAEQLGKQFQDTLKTLMALDKAFPGALAEMKLIDQALVDRQKALRNGG